MYRLNHYFLQEIGLLGTFLGTLFIGLSATNQSAVAQRQVPKVNPCPQIFYEEPHRNRVLVPSGCPPNAATLRFKEQGRTTNSQSIILGPCSTGEKPTTGIQQPLPESQQSAIATVTPRAGTVDVKLKNNTNTPISYQVIGHTQTRYLPGGQEFVLKDLPTPVTITVVRQDSGLLKVIPTSTSEGTIAVSLDETTNFGNNQGVLRIQNDGQVFWN
jgi:hypothetical protein